MKKALVASSAVIAAIIIFAVPAMVFAQDFDYGGDYGGYGYDYGGYDYGNYSDGYGYSDPCGFDCGGSYGSGYGGSFFGGGCGFGCGGYGGGFYFNPLYLPPIYTSPPVYIFPPPIVIQPPIYQPPIYLPPLYTPPVYQPPVYFPPVYQPPIYTPPPVYYPPPVYTAPPIVCSVSLSNFNPPLIALPWQLYTYQVSAVSNVNGRITYRIVNGPDGLAINQNTGLITWTPAMNQARTRAYAVTVAAYNGSCENAQTVYVSVENPQPAPKPVLPKPKPPVVVCCSCACPPVAVEKPVQSGCPTTPAITASSNDGGGRGLFAAAIAGFVGGISAILWSPITLIVILIILAILLFRAHRRLRETQITV